MPLKMIGVRSRESSSQVKFRQHLDGAVNSAAGGARVDPSALEGMLSLIRSKEISPGDALSCFKTHFREGSPDEQHNALRVLIQFVDTDPHLANLLHVELASRRWRERFVALSVSPHPEVKPMLVATLSGWAASYRAHDIGLHYQSTLRELTSGSIRQAGPGYNPQHTGYSAQHTGYSTQATGTGYPMPPPPPPPGYPIGPRIGYPAPPPGYPPYLQPYPPPPPPMQQQPSHRSQETVSSKLDQLVSEVELLRGAIRAFEAALKDYKAQRCPYATLSAAMERGQRTADRCAGLQGQLENLVGSLDGGDEAVMARVFSTNDSAVAALEQWRDLANQELVPDDMPGGAAAAASAGAASVSASTSAAPAAAAAAAPPPVPARPPPSPIHLLLGDELPAPTPPSQQQPPLMAAAPNTAAAPMFPFDGGVANGPVANGTTAWPPPASAAGPAGLDAAAAASAGGAAFFALGAGAGALASGGNSGPSAPVVPAADVEGLRAQVLALSSELDKQRRVHQTALDSQEAFHRQELAQVKAQAQTRISELEAALARQQLPAQPSGGASASQHQVGLFGSYGGVAPAAPGPPAPLYGTATVPYPAPPVPMPSGLASTNPFASFAPAPSYGSAAPPPMPAAAPSYTGGGPFASLAQAPPAAPAAPMHSAQPAPAPAAAAFTDILSGFDELAIGMSSGGTPPTPPAVAAAAPAPAPGPLPSLFSTARSDTPAAPAPGAADSWVDFGH